MRKAIDIFPGKLADLISKAQSNPTRFAREAGFTPGQIRDWVEGVNVPGLRALDQIGQFFHIPAAELITDGPLPKIVTRDHSLEECWKKVGRAVGVLRPK